MTFSLKNKIKKLLFCFAEEFTNPNKSLLKTVILKERKELTLFLKFKFVLSWIRMKRWVKTPPSFSLKEKLCCYFFLSLDLYQLLREKLLLNTVLYLLP